MNTIIIYASKTGFTKKYAEWLAEELKSPNMDYRQVTEEVLKQAECVIFGGSLNAVGIIGISAIKNHWEILKDKKVLIFATGASPSKKEVLNDILLSNFTPGERARISFYYFRGGFNYRKLPFFDKFKMRLLQMKILLKKKAKRNADEKGMLAIFSRGMDYTNKDDLQPLLEEYRSTKK